MSYEGFKNEKKGLFEKRNYLPPQLVRYGTVQNLTQGGGSLGQENGKPDKCSQNKERSCTSDRSIKENIICIGKHPLGISLYFFNYKPEYRNAWGHGRQFGVMADEVETVMPEAVSVHADGYKMVNYAMLGISRTLH